MCTYLQFEIVNPSFLRLTKGKKLMKLNKFGMLYENILDENPNYFDDYEDSDQHFSEFVYQSSQCPAERFVGFTSSVVGQSYLRR